MVETVTDAHIVKTRKIHHCHGCRRKIEKWELADTWVFKYDGEIYSLYVCTECMDFREKHPECIVDDDGEGCQEWFVTDYKDEVMN